MSKQKKIRSKVKAFLPGADESLIDGLVAKVEQGLLQNKDRNLRNPGSLVRQIIQQEELLELGLK
jgi:hypothetical protein